MLRVADAKAIAAGLIREDDDGFFTWTRWNQLDAVLLIETRVEEDTNPLFQQLHRWFRFLHHDWWNLLTITSKLDWLHEQKRDGSLEELQWWYFVTSDIDGFFVELRSLLDYMGAAAAETSAVPQSTPHTFFRLRDFLQQGNKHRAFGTHAQEVAVILESFSWADQIRSLRDNLVHRGAETFLVLDDEEILFQIHQGLNRLLRAEEYMTNENLLNFRLFAAALLADLLRGLDELAPILASALQVKIEDSPKGGNYHPGLKNIRTWLGT